MNKRDTSSNKYYLLITLVALTAIWNLYAATRGWQNSVLGYNTFRASQTALTAREFIDSGFKLAYETPVFGPPWSIPFEFPVYQIVVASIVKTFGTPLEQTGQFVSLISFYIALMSLIWILKEVTGNWTTGFIAAILALTSPIYIYFSRAFSIEIMSTTLTMLSIVFFLKLLQSPSIKKRYIFLVLIFSILAALSKITTYCIGAGFLILHIFSTYFLPLKKPSSIKPILPLCITLFISITVGYAWVVYGDYLKSQNPTPMAEMILSSNLSKFNYGTLDLKLSIEFWEKVRIDIADTLMGSWLPFIGMLFSLLLIKPSRSSLIISLIFILTFLSGPVVFSNLYYVHIHYWVANGLFLLAGCAIPLGMLFERKGMHKVSILILALLLCANGIISYYDSPYDERQIVIRKGLIKTGEYIEANTKTNDVLLILGHDWNSSIPYASKRKAIMICRSGFEDHKGTKQSIASLPDYGYQLGAFIVFGHADKRNIERINKIITMYNFNNEPLFENSWYLIYKPKDQKN